MKLDLPLFTENASDTFYLNDFLNGQSSYRTVTYDYDDGGNHQLCGVTTCKEKF